MRVLFVVTKFVALLYDDDNVEEKRLESKMETTNSITHFSVLLRSHHQTLSNHMLFASLPLMSVLFVVTFVAL